MKGEDLASGKQKLTIGVPTTPTVAFALEVEVSRRIAGLVPGSTADGLRIYK